MPPSNQYAHRVARQTNLPYRSNQSVNLKERTPREAAAGRCCPFFVFGANERFAAQGSISLPFAAKTCRPNTVADPAISSEELLR